MPDMQTTPDELRGVAIAVLTLAAAVATSTSYVLQPDLRDVAGDLGRSLTLIATVAAVPIAGYLLGLALLVPLADRVRANRLIPAQLGLLAAGLLVAAVAPDPVTLALGLFASGLCASTGAQMSSLAGRYTRDDRRGRVVGTITAGISAGIVLGRILGGVLADLLGWREMLVVFVIACALLAAAASRTLPGHRLAPEQPYVTVVRSLPRLVRNYRTLRGAASAGALWFFAFSLIWVGLSLALARPPVSLSPATIGLYALAGLLGVGATRIAGGLADRHGARPVVLGGLALAAACTVTLAVTLHATPVLLVALALFDAGLFSAQVANQSRVLALDPKRAAQFNGAYMVIYFVGGSVGTAVGGPVIGLVGWAGTAFVATGAIVVAGLIAARTLVLHRCGTVTPHASAAARPAPLRRSGAGPQGCPVRNARTRRPA